MQQDSQSRISTPFLIITCLFVTCLLITNIVAGRLVAWGKMTLTADLFLFPITYIFGDVLTEVYGFRRARITIWLGFAANLLMAAVFIFVVSLPSPSFWEQESAYRTAGLAGRLFSRGILQLDHTFAHEGVNGRKMVVDQDHRFYLGGRGSRYGGFYVHRLQRSI